MNKDISFLYEPFLGTQGALRTLMSLSFSNAPLAARTQPSFENGGEADIYGIAGVIFRYENFLTAFGYGVSSQSLKAKIKSSIEAGRKVLLVIDSGGGTVNGMSDLCDYIAENKENITAFVKGTCASAAFWIASSCGKIYAEKTSLIGSLGVVTSIWDDTKYFENLGIVAKDITSTLAPNKRLDVNSDESMANLKRELDEIANIFISSAAKNRGMSNDEIVSKLENGGVISGELAFERNIIDGITSFENLIQKGAKMEKEQATAQVETKDYGAELKAQEDKTQKFQALASYRNLLSAEDFNRFAADENITAEQIKNHILEKRVEETSKIPSVTAGEDIGKNAANKDVEDAICLISGVEVAEASNRAHRLTQGRLKPLLATIGGLDAAARDSEFMSAMTTSDFPILLRNALSRVLEHGFERAETTYEKIIKPVPHPDFRPYSSVEIQSVPASVWKSLVEGGETGAFTLSENGEVSKLESKGAKFAITRQMLVNDDLGAFTGLVSDFAESAKYHINQCVYEFLEARGAYQNYALKDGKALFHADHANLLTGAPSKLGEAGLSKARLAMLRQKDWRGEKIRVTPKFLIVPPELLDAANQLMISSATLELNKNAGVANVYQAAYSVISDTEIEDKDAWYLASERCVNVGYLSQNGGIKPIIELSKQSLVDGLEYTGVLDFIVYANRYQNLVKNAGK